MKQLILFLMQTQLYRWLLKHVVPFIRFTTYYTSLRGAKYHEGYKLLRPGHIVLTNDRKKLTSLLIPGEFSHAALCVGKGEGWEIAEMTHEDFTKSYFFDLCKEADRVVILECPDFDDDYTKKVIQMCRSFENAHYDVEFNLGIESLYCSELIYQSDFERRLKLDLEDLAGLGRPYISPQGIYDCLNLKIIWDSDNERS